MSQIQQLRDGLGTSNHGTKDAFVTSDHFVPAQW